MDGILNILKPPGMSSHDVVSFIRKATRQKKVGHTGTLDPGAAGVLPICLGRATKIIQFLKDDKEYRAEITFGKATDSQDSFGQVLKAPGAEGLRAAEVENALKSFQGQIKQMPPMTSAIKYQGKKLYQLAREGIEVDRTPRFVYISDIELLEFDRDAAFPKAILHINCSAGTYIRTICHDLGAMLGCGAYMSFLIRTRAGAFLLEDTVTLEQLLKQVGEADGQSALNQLPELMTPMGDALAHLPAVEIADSSIKYVLCGNSIPVSSLFLPTEQPVRLEKDGAVIAIAIVKNSQKADAYLQPVKVLA